MSVLSAARHRPWRQPAEEHAMARLVTIAAAQLGPIARNDSRSHVVERLIAHLREARRMGCDLVVFPELALTTFFPRWYMTNQVEIDSFFERSMPGPETQPLFNEAKRLSLGFYIGYAELTPEGQHFNTSILVGKDGQLIGKYRKVHLPGHREHDPARRFQHLEKRYFDLSDTGFKVWRGFGGVLGMAICNDRRWPETYRVMGLQGAEMILLGYNTPVHNPPAPDHDDLSLFHNQLVMQAGAYQNGCWVIGVAKAGNEEGVPMIGGSQIIAPSGVTVAATRGDGDEMAVACCDLDACASYKSTTFNFAVHRMPQHYGLIVERKGAEPPP
jgi:predicted amidohydrolase